MGKKLHMNDDTNDAPAISEPTAEGVAADQTTDAAETTEQVTEATSGDDEQ